jgi:lipopolysaccharide exporter
MSSAPFLTQVISFLLMPIIGRLYTPVIFGIFNLYGSLVGPISALSTLGYHQAIVLSQKKSSTEILTYGSLLFSILIAFITLAIIFFLPDNFWFHFSLESVKTYRWLIPISILFHGIHTTLSSLNQGNARFGTIAFSRVSNALINKFSIIILAILGYKTSGSLIIGTIFGALSMVVILGIPNLKLFTNAIHLNREPFIKYKNFPIFVLSTDFIYRLTNALIIYSLAYYFGEKVVGYYGMAIMLAGIPTILIGSAIGEVFYQKAAEGFGKENKINFYEKLFSYLIKLSLLPFIILAIIAPELFSIILGENWGDAGIFVQLLSFQMFIAFIITPIISLSKIYNKQEYALISQILILVTSLCAIAFGGYIDNVYWGIFIMSIFTGLINFIFGVKILKVAGLSIYNNLRLLSEISIYYFLVIFTLIGIRIFIDSTIILYFFIGVIILFYINKIVLPLISYYNGIT